MKYMLTTKKILFTTALLVGLNVGSAAAISADTTQAMIAVPEILVLSPGESATTAISVIDSLGNTVAGALTYSGFDTSLVDVSIDGIVTGKAADTTGAGTKVFVSVDGTFIDRPVIVRMFDAPQVFNFETIQSEKNRITYPSTIDGVDLTAMMADFDVLNVLDHVHAIEGNFVNTDPLGDNRQIILIEPQIAAPATICSNFDNHFRISWPAGTGTNLQNCFQTGFVAPYSPAWDFLFHEIGHEYHLASPVFRRGISQESILFYESLADLFFHAVSQELLTNPSTYPINEMARASIEAGQQSRLRSYENQADDWITEGARQEDLTRFILIGLVTKEIERRPDEFYERLYYIFRPENEAALETVLQQVEANGSDGVTSFFVALLSATLQTDLSSLFGDDYGFIIDETLFNDGYTTMEAILQGSIFSGVEQVAGVPNGFELSQNYPNPFNPTTTISFSVAQPSAVSIRVFDLTGKHVATVADETLGAGNYTVEWNAENLPSGTYIYKFSAGEHSESRVLTLLK